VIAIGLVEEIVQGGIDPHPAPVLVLAAAAHLLSPSGRQHRYPALDGPRLVFGMDLVEHTVADQLLGRIPEHLRERLVRLQDGAVLVLEKG
jgi:hypothetical protein